MKYDIVIKKRENTLKQLEETARICYQFNKIHIPEDVNKQILKRILNSLDPSIILDFDQGLHTDFEDPNQILEQYKEMTHGMVLDLEVKIRELRYEYIKLRAKEKKLSGPIHLYEYSKKGLWFKIRKILLWVSLVLIVFLSALALHSQISYTLNFYFNFDLYKIISKILASKLMFVIQFLLLIYISAAALYANCRIEIRHWYLLVNKSSSISSLLFYIL
jgi:hypothetical protein